MEYSEFKLAQIIEHYDKYQEICNIFFELANDIETKLKLESILYKGGYKDYSVCSKIVHRNDPGIEGKRRISMAYLLLKNPETFDELVENKINLFHGTNANALPSILKYGLNSHKKSEENDIVVSTGEQWSRINGPRNFISFTDDLEVAQFYSSKNLKEEEYFLSFEVIIGTSVDNLLHQRTRLIFSELPEIGVETHLPLDNIKTICVPSDKVEFVKKLMNTNEIKVLPMDDINEKFYYIQQETGDIEISYEDINKLRSELYKNKKTKVFGLEEIKNMTCGRFLKRIKEQLKKFKSIIIDEREVRYDGRKIK